MQQSSSTWREPLRETGTHAPPVRIWRLRLSDLAGDPGETLRSLTVPSEHARARRYRFDADRHRHLAGRGLVRAFLSIRYGCAPGKVSINEGPHGKPRLNGGQADEPALRFNIAHTEDVVVAAFSRTHPVGIDVESLNRDTDVEALAERVFTEAERQRWRTLPDARRGDVFLHVWTCKEAFLKATGHGLQRAPHTVECLLDDERVMGLDDAKGYQPPSPTASAARWALRPLPASGEIVGAVVRKHTLPSPLTCADASRLVNRLSPS